MPISKHRILLRPLEPRDAKALFCITHDPVVEEYVPNAYTISEQEALDNIVNYYSKGDFVHDFYYAITLANQTMIGVLIVTQNENHEFDVASAIGKEYRNRGYVKEALQLFMDSMPKDSKLVFTVKRSNKASINSLSFFKLTIELSDSEDEIKFVHIV